MKRLILFTVAVFLSLAGVAQARGTVIFGDGPCYNRQVDPVVQFGTAVSAHMHSICGIQNITGSSTVASIKASPATVANRPRSVKTVHWIPAGVSPLGQYVAPTNSKFDYSNGCNINLADKPCPPPASTRQPDGFSYVIGDKNNQTRGTSIGQFRCAGAPTTTQKLYIPTNCDAFGNKGVQGAIYGPICWDGVNPGPGLGKNTGPADAKSHLSGMNTCGGAYPVRIGSSIWAYTWPASMIGGKLACDTTFNAGGACMHVDHVDIGAPNSRGEDGLNKIFAMCLNFDQSTTLQSPVTCTTNSAGVTKRVSDGAFVTD